MNNNLKNKYENKLILILIAFITITACNDEYLDMKNPNNFDATTYYTNAENNTKAVNAIYSIMLHQGMFSRDWYFNFDLLANEAGPLTPLQGQIAELPRGAYDASNSALAPTWDRLYRMVLRSNYAIEVVTKWTPTKESDIALKTRLIGEAQFFLGFAYYHLGSLWGSVPLRKSFEETGKNLNIARSTQSEVFTFAEENLKAAANALPPKYERANNGRATQLGSQSIFRQIVCYARQLGGS
ncbi:MAG: hypothetical protein HC905_13370 [Bacteroidales bacterium]|nr:hypothetical protein [Bacteroidales bacterium]